MSRQYVSLIGKRFGRLLVKNEAPINKHEKQVSWSCLCECGNTSVVLGRSLTSGNTKSCGCLRGDKIKERSTTHGQSRTRLYRKWVEFRARCNNPKSDSYKYYGGKGLSYFKDWDSFDVFYKFAMENGYKEALSIERIDNSKGYFPDNVTFIPLSQQPINRSISVWLEYKGDIKLASDWSRILGIPDSTLSRWYRKGISIEEGLEKRHPKLLYKGDYRSMGEWERILGIPHQYISNWYRKGLSLEEIVEKRNEG